MDCAPVRRDNYRPYRRTNMLYLTCTTITSVDLPHYGVSRAKDWVSVDCGTSKQFLLLLPLELFNRFLLI